MKHEHYEPLFLAFAMVLVLVAAAFIIDCRFDKLEDFHEPTQDGEGM